VLRLPRTSGALPILRRRGGAPLILGRVVLVPRLVVLVRLVMVVVMRLMVVVRAAAMRVVAVVVVLGGGSRGELGRGGVQASCRG